MSAEAKPTTAPPPVFARRHVKPQYLAPGQHLKIASRKPPSKTVEPECRVPRDPWEKEEDTFEKGSGTPDARSPPAAGGTAASSSTSGQFGGGGGESCRSPHSRPSTGGHPFSSHLSRSRSSIASDTSPTKGNTCATQKANHHRSTSAESDQTNAAGQDNVDSDAEEDYYHVAPEAPQLTPAQRAQQVVEMQQRALEVKQLQALTQQGVARRPKTLVRNRHGRLQAIAAASPATSAESPTPQIMDAPVSMKGKPRPKASRRDAPAAAAKKKTSTTVEVARGGDDDLVNSQPSTPTRRDAARLDIDLD